MATRHVPVQTPGMWYLTAKHVKMGAIEGDARFIGPRQTKAAYRKALRKRYQDTEAVRKALPPDPPTVGKTDTRVKLESQPLPVFSPGGGSGSGEGPRVRRARASGGGTTRVRASGKTAARSTSSRRIR